MIKRLLIANRGEIACRIIRTAKQMGITTVAIFSEADRLAKHRWLADEAYCVGSAPVRESYLHQENIISIALSNQVDAIHPGYGFLSENPTFAQTCLENNLIWVGPHPLAMAAMGIKDEAKRLMEKAGVPVIPGFHDTITDTKHLYQKALDIGFPLLIKASHGGGGKGMRLVRNKETLQDAIDSAMREAKNAFGESAIFIEKYLEHARHIEVQIIGDKHGNICHLWDRDCSLQRRHQKVIETAPAHFIPDPVRAELHQAAIKAAASLQYDNAGTIEFLLDTDNRFYFLEMNTRLQVEHPVTECITGIDLVATQLQVADGLPLPFSQTDISCHGFAAEARLYAEDPDNQFLPTTGKISALHVPTLDFLRVDSGIQNEDIISVHYDPLLAKLIVWSDSREQTLARLETALNQTLIFGLTTNLPFLRRLLHTSTVKEGLYSTKTIESHPEWCTPPAMSFELIAIATILSLEIIAKQAIMAATTESNSPWYKGDGWSLVENKNTIAFRLNHQIYEVDYIRHINTLEIQYHEHPPLLAEYQTIDDCSVLITINAHQYRISFHVTEHMAHFVFEGEEYPLAIGYDNLIQSQHAQHENACKAPMPGIITQIFVKPGTCVSKGDKLVALEAMKMEHTLSASQAGTVKSVSFSVGDQVEEGALLLELDYHE